MNKKIILSCIVLLSGLFVTAENPLWMRYPVISPDGTQIAFSYQGDIYKVAAVGGQATRLTTNDAYESNPIWSPDGQKIAFVSDRFNFNKDIFVMPLSGGTAKRLTTHSATEKPYAFTCDGKFVVFSSHYQDPVQSALFPTAMLSELYKVPVEGGRIEMILASPAEKISFNKTGSKFLYQDLKGFENTWRKHHTSSVTRDILEYDMKTGTNKKLIDRPGEDTDPVYSPDGNSFFFLSEKSGSYNIFEAPISNPQNLKQLTSFSGNPVRFLSVATNGTICFGYDGEIYTLKKGAD
ncbi:MAG: hypothetical protein H6Q19_708, partial [Bacteroidetes bacterium]|nr:hypothetical protein [Bacteroidota bacterium]